MIARLQYISQEPHLANIQSACEAGCKWVQLRAKNLNTSDYVQLAKETKQITQKFGVPLIINDNLDVALEIDAFGVHLGKNDMDLAEARKIAGDKLIIGGSTNSLDDILMAADKGVNYLGLGPFRYTTTKTDLNPVLGLEGMNRIMNEVQKRNIQIPIIAIGGIQVEDISNLKEIGIYGVAVSGLISASENKIEIVQSLAFNLSEK